MVTDYIKRFMIVAVIALFIGFLFIGSKSAFANTVVDDELINSLIWPTEGIISDTYGTRMGNHFGIDIAAPQGTPIVSIDNGVINKSYYSDTYGNVIFIEHESGLEAVYAHLHERYVREGDIVNEGTVIGTVGNTGRSTGDHLHFEVHVGNWNMEKSNSIDPMLILLDPDTNLVYKMNEKDVKSVLSNRISIIDEYDHEFDDQLMYGFKTQVASVVSGKQEEEEEGKEKVVTVKEKDTLWSISNQYQVTVNDLIEWNDLHTNILSVGQELKIYPYDETIYFVQRGDTLNEVAQQFGLSTAQLMRLNGLNNHMIFIGDILKVK